MSTAAARRKSEPRYVVDVRKELPTKITDAITTSALTHRGTVVANSPRAVEEGQPAKLFRADYMVTFRPLELLLEVPCGKQRDYDADPCYVTEVC